MRSGVVGMVPTDPDEVTEDVARRIRAAGFTGVTYVLLDPMLPTRPDLEGVRDVLAGSGVRVAQANPRYEILVHPDEGRRSEGIETLQRACRCARWLDAATVYVRPGGLNWRGPWFAHPLNTHPETLERLIDSLRRVVPAAEDEGVVLAVEGHVLSPLNSPRRVREVIETVGSPALRFNADPVNFVGSLADAYESRRFLDDLFDVLGEFTVCAHVKDLGVADKLVLHIEERVPGEGLLDMETFLRRFDSACPDGFALIEHLSEEDIPRAKQAVDRAARRAGLAWRE